MTTFYVINRQYRENHHMDGVSVNFENIKKKIEPGMTKPDVYIAPVWHMHHALLKYQVCVADLFQEALQFRNQKILPLGREWYEKLYNRGVTK